jgi:hypothetical protein
VQIWDLAGQDVYTLSHAVHFSHRCLYALLWKPYEALPTVMLRVAPWLESLCAHVPDAHVVLVASHCKTNIREEEFLELSGQVEAAARAKVEELNDMTRLEVDKLRTQLAGAEAERQRLEDEYAAHASSTPELTLADSACTRLSACAAASGQTKQRGVIGRCSPLSPRVRLPILHPMPHPAQNHWPLFCLTPQHRPPPPTSTLWSLSLPCSGSRLLHCRGTLPATLTAPAFRCSTS